MDDRTRRAPSRDSDEQEASRRSEADETEDLYNRREQTNQRPALTRREREDRWPIG